MVYLDIVDISYATYFSSAATPNDQQEANPTHIASAYTRYMTPNGLISSFYVDPGTKKKKSKFPTSCNAGLLLFLLLQTLDNVLILLDKFSGPVDRA